MTEPEEIFSNNQIDLQRLPQADELAMISLEPAYKKLRYVSGVIIAVILMIITWGLSYCNLSIGLTHFTLQVL